MIKGKIIIVLILLVLFQTARSQELIRITRAEFKQENAGFAAAWDNLKRGDMLFQRGKAYYNEALYNYLKAYSYNSDNPELNYRMGVCYLFADNKNKAEKHLRYAYKSNREISSDILLLLGRACHHNLKFEEALNFYIQYEHTLDTREFEQQIRWLEKLKTECDTAKYVMKCTVNVHIENMGDSINTIYADYLPLITADQSKMLFTSQRYGTTGNVFNSYTNAYKEDVFETYNKGDYWTEAKKLGRKINSDDIDAAIGMSGDGTTVFFYNGMRYNGNIYYANYKNGKYTEKMPLPLSINTKEQEVAATFMPGNKQLLFVSNRDDINFGKHDIYISKRRSKRRWSQPLNIGSTVNTPFDENFVFMHPDGKTMYFSSEGHNSIGGYDIFKTTYNPNTKTWQRPVNMGYPVNTPADDCFFVLAPDGKTGYFSSNRHGGAGDLDIYKVTFNQTALQPCNDSIQHVNRTTKHALTFVHGKISDTLLQQKVQVDIEVFDVNNYKQLKKIKTDKLTGEYLFILPVGFDYAVFYSAKKRLFISEDYLLETDSAYNEYTKILMMPPLKEGGKLPLNNIYFMRNDEKLSPKSLFELETLAKFMKFKWRYRWTFIIEDNYNRYTDTLLTQKRVKMLKKYFAKNGIPNRKISTKAMHTNKHNITNLPIIYLEIRKRKGLF